MKTYRALFVFLLFTAEATAQQTHQSTKEKILAEADMPDIFAKKFKFGLSWNQYWATIKGTNLPEEYFAKPAVGINLRLEYYPFNFIGIGGGFGVQQRGAGIINEDNSGGTFTKPWFGAQGSTEDSTYRQRLRMNTIEVPITLLLRTPKDVVKGVRLSAAAGINWIKNDYVKDFWHKPEDGFHTITDVADQYIKNDLLYQFSFGADMSMANLSVFQFHLVYTRGTKNIFTTGGWNGNVETYGFRVAWLY
jgi:hypothetical protein